MKRLTGALAVVMLVGGLMWCTNIGSSTSFAGEPMVVNGTPVVKMDKKTAFVSLYGTGFKPGQEVRILFATKDGVRADIGYALKPELQVNELGQWVTQWNCWRYIRKKLIKPGVYTLTVTDGEYSPIAQVPVAFKAVKKKKKEKKKK